MTKKFEFDEKYFIELDGKKITIRDLFKRVTRDFISGYKNATDLMAQVMFSGVLLEATIKYKLFDISPVLILDKIDSESIAVVLRKEKKLLKQSKNISEVKSASISELINRFELFFDVKNEKSNLSSFLRNRNKIAHFAIGSSILEGEIAVQLSRDIFPFIKRYVAVEDRLWQGIIKIADVANDAFRVAIARDVLQFRDEAPTNEKTLKILLGSKIKVSDDETLVEENLVCPSCANESMALISGIENDWGQDGVLTLGYSLASCRVCGLALSPVEYEEILDHPDLYFKPTPPPQAIEQWRNAIMSIKDPGEYFAF